MNARFRRSASAAQQLWIDRLGSPDLRRTEAWLDRLDLLDALELPLARGLLDDPAGAQRLRAMRRALESMNEAYFAAVRARIRSGDGDAALRAAIAQGRRYAGEPRADRYDVIDGLIGGVLGLAEPDACGVEPPPEHVFYQPTPARLAIDLLDRLGLAADDVLVDLGSGLGHVILLAAMLTPACGIGVEYEGAYVESARACAGALQLGRAQFLQQDAASADLSVGSVFYLYTPFVGDLLRGVLAALREQARGRDVRIATLGPCSAILAAEPWLRAEGRVEPHRPVLFHTCRAG